MTLVRKDARADDWEVPTLFLSITDGGPGNSYSVVKQMAQAASRVIELHRH